MARQKPGDITSALNRLYSYGRSFPNGGRPSDVTADGTFKSHDITPPHDPPDPAQQAVQDPEGKHAAGYDNEPSIRSWLRGGADRPGFDHSPPRSKMRR